MNALVATIVLGATLAVSAAAAETPDRVAEGRKIAQEFGTELRGALEAAMAEGGPLAAIRVCNEDAPAIARAAAEESGAEVGRTSDRLRNPGNAPDAHERAMLADFAAIVATGEAKPPIDRLDTLPDGRVRYMSAIIVQPPCLACHGENLAPQLAEAIDTLYPEDEARGYALGELRGAFTITWPTQ